MDEKESKIEEKKNYYKPEEDEYYEHVKVEEIRILDSRGILHKGSE